MAPLRGKIKRLSTKDKAGKIKDTTFGRAEKRRDKALNN